MTTGTAPKTFVGKRFTLVTVALLAIAAFVIAAISVIQLASAAMSAGDDITVPVTVDKTYSAEVLGGQQELVETAGTSTLPPNIQLGMSTEAAFLTVPDSTLGENLLLAGGSALAGLGIAVGLLLAVLVLKEVALGRPFRDGNATKIAVIGIITVAVGLLPPLISGFASMLVVDRALPNPGTGIGTQISLGISYVIVGLVIGVIADVFRAGHAATKEVEGLI